MKDSTHEEPLIHVNIWIRNDAVVKEEDDEAEGSRRSLATKKLKISIQFHFMILFGCALIYIQLMYYACLSVFIYTTKLHMMGKKSLMLYNIILLLIYI